VPAAAGLQAMFLALVLLEDGEVVRVHGGREVADRVGVATSALRFYEDNGLIDSQRTDAGHRRYRADVLRRVSFIRTAQRVGLSLDEVGAALASLPARRTPTAADWARLARRWGPRLDEQIAVLTRLRDQLDSCIGCGCLSLESCGIWNPDDTAADLGSGPRYLLGDERPVTLE
jgi:MerR family transcriptional regulator, redox-sensitive transcriptional activator SoxR